MSGSAAREVKGERYKVKGQRDKGKGGGSSPEAGMFTDRMPAVQTTLSLHQYMIHPFHLSPLPLGGGGVGAVGGAVEVEEFCNGFRYFEGELAAVPFGVPADLKGHPLRKGEVHLFH